MAYLIFGSKRYIIDGVLGQSKFRVSDSVFSGASSKTVEACVKDFIKLIWDAGVLVEKKSIPEFFHESEIKHDVLRGDERHDAKVQAVYLKETRKYWEARYSFRELIWLIDFSFYANELEGKIGVEWYKLYEIVRGELPRDYPTSISFNTMIDNVWNWKTHKHIRKVMKEYFARHSESIDVFMKMSIPDDLPLDSEIGLTVEEFFNFARGLVMQRIEKQKRTQESMLDRGCTVEI